MLNTAVRFNWGGGFYQLSRGRHKEKGLDCVEEPET